MAAGWSIKIDRLGGAGYEGWETFAMPETEIEIESVAVARAGRARVTFTDPPAPLEHGWHLRISRDSVEQFEGRISGLARRDDGSSVGPRITTVTATDWDTLLDDDIVPRRYRSVAETAGARIRWLVQTFGTHGITAGPECQDIIDMPAGGDGRPEQEFGPSTLREAIRKVTRISGGTVYVDGDKRLRHFLVENIAAPFGLSDTPNGVTTFDFHEFRLDDDAAPRVDEVTVFGAAGIEVTRLVANPPPVGRRRRAPLVDQNLTSVAAATAAGDAFLREHAPRRSGSLRTLRAGLRAGMDVQITHQGHGWVALPVRIHTVRTRFEGPEDGAVYTIRFGDRPVDLAELIGGSDGLRTTGRETALAAAEGARRIADLQVAGANLIVNSSMESASIQGTWTVGAQWTFGFAPTIPERAFAGARVSRAMPSAATVGDLTHGRIPVDRLADYWLSAWAFMRARTAGSARLWVDEFDGPGVLIRSLLIAEIAIAGSAWARHAIRMGPNDQIGRTAFAEGTASIRLRMASPGSASFTLDTDGWQIERGTLLTAYAPMPQELVDGQVGPTQIADDSITTPKLAAGSVLAHNIAAGQVIAEKIAAGAIGAETLAAEIVLGQTLLATGLTGQRVAIDRTGIRAYDAGGAVVTSIPTGAGEPVSVTGRIEASALLATGAAELRGANTLGGGSITTLQLGIVDPITAPLVEAWTPSAMLEPTQWTPGWGICYDPAGGVGLNVPVYYTGIFDLRRAQRGHFNEHRASDGTLLRTIEGDPHVYAMIGLARVTGQDILWMLQDYDPLIPPNLRLQALRISDLGGVAGPIDASPWMVGARRNRGLFFDGTHLVLVSVTGTTGSDQVRFIKRSATTGALVSVHDTTGLPIDGATAVTRGGYFSDGAYHIVVNGIVRRYDATTWAYQPNWDWGVPAECANGITTGSSGHGVGWSAENPNRIWLYTPWIWTGGGTDFWVCYTWHRSTTPVRETAVSPRTRLTTGQRRAWRVTNPALPTAGPEPPDRVRIYAARAAADPGGTNYRLQVTDALTGREMPAFNAGGAANPATGNFPPGTPAELRSVGGTIGSPTTWPWRLRADGSKAGFLRFVPITRQALFVDFSHGPGTYTVSATGVPTDGTTVAVAVSFGLDNTGVHGTIFHRGGLAAAEARALHSTEPNFVHCAYVETGGTNNVQFTYSVSGTAELWLYVHGYWTFA
ncbi:MAG TPA: hypothetical protein VLM76_09320 [Patescibacteria group bacterium]|nr:hypothetical protein [Patescibacteria group bacterium]